MRSGNLGKHVLSCFCRILGSRTVQRIANLIKNQQFRRVFVIALDWTQTVAHAFKSERLNRALVDLLELSFELRSRDVVVARERRPKSN